MTNTKLKRFVYLAVFSILALGLLILQSTGLATFKIGNASAVLMLPLTILAGFYFREYTGAVFGIAFGALTDVYSSTICYNTVALAIAGFVSGLLVSRLFNSNLAAVSVLSFGGSALYFFFKWLIIYAFYDPLPGYVLLHFIIPSAVYTALFGILIFFILHPLFRKVPVVEKNTDYDW